MSQCEQCSAELPPTRERFCSNQCGWTYHNARRVEVAKVQDVETPPIHLEAQRLIVTGHLPEAFSIDAHDSRPLWDYIGLCVLLNQRPDQLTQLLLSNGPAYQPGAGIPSSWRALIEL